MARKRLYNVYVMTLQAKSYKDKTHYTIKRWFAYHHVSRRLSCYLMYRKGCSNIVGWNNGKVLLSLDHDQLHGCCLDEARARKLTFCIAQRTREYPSDTDDTSGLIYPSIPVIGCDPSPFFDTAVAETLKFVIKHEHETEHSIQCDRWGAEELVPKGFYLIQTSGIEIEQGDYYWDTHSSRHMDCWTSVDRTYSEHKPGKKIGTVNWFGKTLTDPLIIRRYKNNLSSTPKIQKTQ